MGSRLLPALLLLLVTSGAGAQGWVAEAAAGRAVYDPLHQSVGALNASAGLRYGGDTNRWMHLFGGVNLEEDGPAWLAGGAGGWLGVRRGTFALGADLGAETFVYSASAMEDAGAAATLEALPTLHLRRGPAELALHSGVLQTAYASAQTLLARTAFDGGGSVALSPLPGLRIGAEGRYLLVPEGGRPYVGGSAQLSGGWGAVWAFGGRWLTDDMLMDVSDGYGIGGSVHLPAGVSLHAGWQQEPSHPLYLSSARRTWSVRISRALAGRASAPAPLPLVLPEPADGRVTLRLPRAEHPEAPSVLGDFTGWEPVPLTAAGEFWEVRLEVAPGVYHYGFRSAAGEWFVPSSLPQADDGMGGTSAVLVVR